MKCSRINPATAPAAECGICPFGPQLFAHSQRDMYWEPDPHHSGLHMAITECHLMADLYSLHFTTIMPYPCLKSSLLALLSKLDWTGPVWPWKSLEL